MREKVSERHLREEKVKKVKEKILTEISEKLVKFKKEIILHVSNDECFDYYIKRCFALHRLKEYLGCEYTFMEVEVEYPDRDIIIYTISDRDLNIWLQDTYSFTSEFLHNAVEFEHDIYSILNDRYFAHQFINLIDYATYDEKKEGN